MEIVQALEWRYATKKFNADKLLSEEKIEILKNTFNLTATSYGLQPLRMVVVQNKELQQELEKASYNQAQISTASHLLVLCIEKEIDRTFIEKYFKYVSDIRKTPSEILSPFMDSLVKDFENKPLEEIRVWATHQAYLVLGALLTTCAVEGIDSCPMEGFEPEKYDELLNLGSHNLKSVLVLPVGYRAEDDKFAKFRKVRRPMEEMVLEIGDE